MSLMRRCLLFATPPPPSLASGLRTQRQGSFEVGRMDDCRLSTQTIEAALQHNQTLQCNCAVMMFSAMQINIMMDIE